MSDNNTNSEKKTLRLKSVVQKEADIAALGTDVSDDSEATVKIGDTPVVAKGSYAFSAIVAVIATVIFAAIVAIQLLELKSY